MADYIENNGTFDLICFDANEPKEDFGDIEKNIYWHVTGDKGRGAKTFLKVMVENNLRDSYIPKSYGKEPLEVSHIIKGCKLKKRYDYIYSNNCWNITNTTYLYDESIKAGSDHAMIISDFNINI